MFSDILVPDLMNILVVCFLKCELSLTQENSEGKIKYGSQFC